MLLFDGIFADNLNDFMRNAVRQENILTSPGVCLDDAKLLPPAAMAGEFMVLNSFREFTQTHIHYLWHN